MLNFENSFYTHCINYQTITEIRLIRFKLCCEIIIQCSFEGTSGNIKSFNNGGTGTHLTNQKYTACIRLMKQACHLALWPSLKLPVFNFY